MCETPTLMFTPLLALKVATVLPRPVFPAR